MIAPRLEKNAFKHRSKADRLTVAANIKTADAMTSAGKLNAILSTGS